MSRGAQTGAPNRSEAEIARHSGTQQSAGKQTTRSVARRAALRGRSAVNITEDLREYAAEHKISEQEARNKGMEEKSKDLVEKGAEVYAKA